MGFNVEEFESIFIAQITDKTQVSGVWHYAWTEQEFDPKTGIYDATQSPRTGTTVQNYATELNNEDSPLMIYVWLRFKGIVLGQAVYEFSLLPGLTCMEVMVPPLECAGNGELVYNTKFVLVSEVSGCGGSSSSSGGS